MTRRCLLILGLFLLSACGKDSPTGPSSTPSAAQPTGPVSLTGTVAAIAGAGGRLSGATVTILDGANVGRSTTTSTDGTFQLGGLTPANANVSAIVGGYEESRRGVYIDGLVRLDFTLRPVTWTISGFGNQVFDMPRYVTRVRIVGVWNGRGTSNFAVRVSGRLIVNTILREAPGRMYDGTHLVNGGGVTETLISDNVNWTFTEVR